MGKVCSEYISGFNLFQETTKEWIFYFLFFFIVTHPPLPLCVILSVIRDRIRILTYCTNSHPQLHSHTQTEKVLGVLDKTEAEAEINNLWFKDCTYV